MQAAVLNPLRHPLAYLQARLQSWWQSRLPVSDALFLTQRNVYILPTRAGFMLGATLLVLLIASINYQLNLGYLLTFLLAGCAVVSMHVSHGNLRGVQLSLSPPQAVFSGQPVNLRVHLSSSRKSSRFGIALGLIDGGPWQFCDVPAQGSVEVEVTWLASQRGLHPLPSLSAETRFPIGTFRAWTVWRPASKYLVYPQPERNPPPLPASEPGIDGEAAQRRSKSGEFDGVRNYQWGDPLKLIVWKKVAQNGTLVSRDTQQTSQFKLWLDGSQAGGGSLELQLSRLCAWVLEADQSEIDYGLRLDSLEIPFGRGEQHRTRCLEALALC
jgi:uncharacterized protein (DUF58 family)